MDIPLHAIVGWIGTIFALAGSWFSLKFRVDNLTDKMTETIRQLESFWKYKEQHDKDSSDFRMNVQTQINKHDGRLDLNEQSYSQILKVMEEIKQDVRELKNSKGGTK